MPCARSRSTSSLFCRRFLTARSARERNHWDRSQGGQGMPYQNGTGQVGSVKSQLQKSKLALGEFAALGEGHDAVAGPEGQRHNGHRGLAATGRDQATAVAQEQIFYVVGLVIGIDDGSFGIIAHAAGAEQVHAELLFVDVESPFLFGVGGIEELYRTMGEPVREFQIVRMVFVCQAKRGKPPGVFHIGIDREAVIFHGQRSAVAENFKSARPVMCESRLEIFSPARRARRKPPDAKSNRRQIKTGVETATTIEADF